MPRARSDSAAPPAAAAATPRKQPSPAQKALHKLGLVRDIDLALHLPLRYEDETRITPIRNARDGDTVQIEATVVACEISLRPRRQLVVTVEDDTGTCELRFFSFYPSHQKTMAVGARLRVRGEIKGGFWGRQMLHPAFRLAGGELPAALTPIYPTVAQLPQAYLRRAVAGALVRVDLSDTLPPGAQPPVQMAYGPDGLQRLWKLREALWFFAPSNPRRGAGHAAGPQPPRLAAAESRGAAGPAAVAAALQARTGPAARPGAAPQAGAGAAPLHEQLLAALPFGLTGAQHRVGEEIAHDLARPVPMHRLLQGDVGSGKTVVAALAAAVCMDAGWQCALMAPTEILAEQHFAKLVGWLEPLLAASGRRIAWLAGGQKKKERAAMLALAESGEAALVVGTHAVIQEQVRFKNLALAVIDEQHRFGVAQRLALRKKLEHHGMEPHLLMMSATPIPRTLAMSYYADLDVSTIDELPPGRTPSSPSSSPTAARTR